MTGIRSNADKSQIRRDRNTVRSCPDDANHWVEGGVHYGFSCNQLTIALTIPFREMYSNQVGVAADYG